MTAFSLERRSFPDSLRYLAAKLRDGQEHAGPVMFALDALADEIETSVPDLLASAVTTDGGHHKQWYLERIAAVLGLALPDHDPGIAP